MNYKKSTLWYQGSVDEASSNQSYMSPGFILPIWAGSSDSKDATQPLPIQSAFILRQAKKIRKTVQTFIYPFQTT